MPIFSKESLDQLRQKIDLVEVLSAHIDLKRSGASYKGLCPFHDEKTPSFLVQKEDTHYHCFGCGAHGDSIQFLMAQLKMTFFDAVESLAQRFNVPLQYVETADEKKGPNKVALKNALENACQFFHTYLLHTQEGHFALQYLYSRGIDLDFIYRFRIGLAPKERGLLRKVLHAKFISDEVMCEAGIISEGTTSGHETGWRDFFQDRITFPICDPTGSVIGFSARKYKEETFGGKYINTSETPLFKKSKVLFGLNYCRKRIAKERKAIIVEGQIDALRLISMGYNITVAGQGTAFGEGHVKELLALGLNEVYLAFDSDEAGMQATVKVGDLFQKEGVGVQILVMPKGNDPDLFLKENGPEAFLELMKSSIDYITFLVGHLSRRLDVRSPAGKNEIIQTIIKQIRAWSHALMIHESLRRLAHLMQVPEAMVGVGQNHMPNIYIKHSGNIGLDTIDPDRILESDFLRWILLTGEPKFVESAQKNLKPEYLRIQNCRNVYEACLTCYTSQIPIDLLSVAGYLKSVEDQSFLTEILQKKVNREKAEEHYYDTIQKILNRNWMEKRESLKVQIQTSEHSEDDVLKLVKQFDDLQRLPPKLI